MHNHSVDANANAVTDLTQADLKVDKTLEDQTYGIKALLLASQFTGLKLYEWSAIDAYYFMNRSLWNSKLGYYSSTQNGDIVNYSDFTSTLESLVLLRSVLDKESLNQLNQIISVSSARLELEN